MTPRLLVYGLVAVTTLGAGAGDVQVVEIGWDEYRHYVAAHVWIADMDFRDDDVQSFHVCVGFNAFNHYGRDPSQMARYGFEGAERASREARAATFTVLMNADAVFEKASSYVQEIIGSGEYTGKSGDDRLRYARDVLWKRTASDPDVETAVRQSMRELREVTITLVDAGIITGGSLPDDPYAYMLGVSAILSDWEIAETVIADKRFQALPDDAAKGAFFTEEFSVRVTAAAEIEDEQEQEGFRNHVRTSIDRMMHAGGSYVLRLTRQPDPPGPR